MTLRPEPTGTSRTGASSTRSRPSRRRASAVRAQLRWRSPGCSATRRCRGRHRPAPPDHLHPALEAVALDLSPLERDELERSSHERLVLAEEEVARCCRWTSASRRWPRCSLAGARRAAPAAPVECPAGGRGQPDGPDAAYRGGERPAWSRRRSSSRRTTRRAGSTRIRAPCSSTTARRASCARS